MKALKNRDEFQKAKRWADNHTPKSITLSLWLKINLDRPGGVGTSEKPIAYADDWPQPRIVAGVDFVENHHVENFPTFCFFANISREESEILENFLTELGDVVDVRRIGFVEMANVNEEWWPTCREVFADRFELNASIGLWPSNCYWITELDCDRLQNQHIDAPDGFEFGSLESTDAEFVDELWPHRFEGSSKQFQRRITDFPNVCLKQNGIIASFELVHQTLGIMNHLYTLEKFRRRGLATLVELKLAQKMIAMDYAPVKTIIAGNVEGQKITDASPWWTYIGQVSYMRFGNERMALALSTKERRCP